MKDCDDALIDRVLSAATAVHRELGPGLLESVYELALLREFAEMGISASRQVEVPVFYRGENLGTGFRADIVVEDKLLLELESVDAIAPLHVAQLMTYLKLMGFKARLMKEGIKRVSI